MVLVTNDIRFSVLIDNKPALVQIMAWAANHLSEPTTTKFTDTYMCHQTLICYKKTSSKYLFGANPNAGSYLILNIFCPFQQPTIHIKWIFESLPLLGCFQWFVAGPSRGQIDQTETMRTQATETCMWNGSSTVVLKIWFLFTDYKVMLNSFSHWHGC